MKLTRTVSVAVTGGTGQIAYSFLFALAHGDVFGNDCGIDLRVYDLPGLERVLSGVRMELDDCAYPLLQSLRVTTSLEDAFDGIDAAFLIGAVPRGPGMERSDLLKRNGEIFSLQGSVLNTSAKRDAKILVVGNPVNTNCWIAMNQAPKLNRRNFHSMLRLDQNRMHTMLAHRAEVPLDEVTHVVIWGNHSAKQVPDFTQALISGKPAVEVISDRDWLENIMLPSIQNRGSAVIEARGKSSAGSAARALAEAARSIFLPKDGEWFSTGVCSDYNPYGIPEDLIFGFPCRMLPSGDYEIVPGLSWDAFIKNKIQISLDEISQEKANVSLL
ncbi:Malate dehydrogenase,malate dehydrogenase,malate dehydrogenase,lactate/malate dehydrogenase, NAD binding domain [Chlamydia poikilotherma]|uniref:Malate dehydrogenase n=1 Tax=Chlamydia poikilotherma TaxID=1967783 RepID=A0A3B0PSP0_9CHLA|nr:malate dehydrogenase [Chlamydia poikilotherma]SYX09198.1 Malate dehydrogenase,malate dehydrogenase,malate dehydrogenase,lactate/malate dehydrogenase, NAD binding domain [Chlamydia poikilotherma]